MLRGKYFLLALYPLSTYSCPTAELEFAFEIRYNPFFLKKKTASKRIFPVVNLVRVKLC